MAETVYRKLLRRWWAGPIAGPCQNRVVLLVNNDHRMMMAMVMTIMVAMVNHHNLVGFSLRHKRHARCPEHYEQSN